MKLFRSFVSVLFLLVVPVLSSHAAQIQYRDWTVGTLVMLIQESLYDQAKVYNLGPTSDSGIFQAAMLISENPEEEDHGEKNAVLLECGMHGREWYAAEACYWFIDYLLANRNRSEVRNLLSQVNIWVIPQSNPGGRNIDDLMFGNPTRFAYVCDGGTRVGLPCDFDTDCIGGGLCFTKGWRSNANFADCELGVDPARNFSSGWDDAPKTCGKRWCSGGTQNGEACNNSNDCNGGSCVEKPMHYRGPHPFSERETLNLRRFINNHMISTVALFHSNSQQIYNIWANQNSALDFMTNELEALNHAGCGVTYADAEMNRDGVGTGSGQFSAWLTRPSDVSGELDYLTERNISTFYFELPIKSTSYASPYRNSASDSSNSWHPSSDNMERLYNDAILDLMTYVARQASSPYCPLDDSNVRLVAECPDKDFGLVGAKIAPALDEPGLLDYDPDTREETLPAGTQRIIFAIQNFSKLPSSTSTMLTFGVTREGGSAVISMKPITLLPGEKCIETESYEFKAGKKYWVSITLGPDDFAANNRKVFAFKVTDPSANRFRTVLGRSVINLDSNASQLSYSGAFVVDRLIKAADDGVTISMHGYLPYINSQVASPKEVSYKLPGGSPWWGQSRSKDKT